LPPYREVFMLTSLLHGHERLMTFPRSIRSVLFLSASLFALVSPQASAQLAPGGWVESQGAAPRARWSPDLLKSFKPDVFLGSHGSFFDFEQKAAKRAKKPNPFIDPEGYRKFVDDMERKFKAAVAKKQ